MHNLFLFFNFFFSFFFFLFCTSFLLTFVLSYLIIFTDRFTDYGTIQTGQPEEGRKAGTTGTPADRSGGYPEYRDHVHADFGRRDGSASRLEGVGNVR